MTNRRSPASSARHVIVVDPLDPQPAIAVFAGAVTGQPWRCHELALIDKDSVRADAGRAELGPRAYLASIVEKIGGPIPGEDYRSISPEGIGPGPLPCGGTRADRGAERHR